MLYKLKKINWITFLFTLVLLFLIQIIVAQETLTNKGKMNVGFEVGIQFTGIDDPYMLISDGGIGYTAGPFFDYYISDIVKLRGGLNFDNRAFTLQDMGELRYDDTTFYYSTSYFDVTENYSVNYLTIPLSLIYVKGNEKFNFFLQATLYYSLFLNSKQTGDFHIYISEKDAPHFDVDGYPEFNIPGDHHFDPYIQTFSTSDIGINLLFGFTFFINPNLGITISPGFSYSFANVWENPERSTTWSHLYKINAGIIYTLKSK